MSDWTGMGPNAPAPKLDPNCQCICHSQPGVMHVAACCSAPPMTTARDDLARALLDARAERDRLRADAQAAVALVVPVAWKYRWKIDGEYVGWKYSDASNAHPSLDGYEEQPLYSAPADGLAAVEALRKERDAAREALMNAGIGLHVAKREAAEAIADRDRLAAANAALRAEAASREMEWAAIRDEIVADRDDALARLAAAQQREAELRKRFADLLWAAHGLSFGDDWNNGVYAKTLGYRQKLLSTVAELTGPKLASPQTRADLTNNGEKSE